jgi:molybdate transport system substrate-binding protein
MKRALFALAVSLFPLQPAARAADIIVMSGGAPKDALLTLVPQFEKLTGHHVTTQHVLVSALRQRILAGETADVLLMPTTVLDNLATLQKILPENRAAFGILKLVAIVKDGAPRPDISTVDAFRRALVEAPSVVYSTPASTPSGAHMASTVSQLGISDTVERKVTYRPALEGGVSMVAEGRAAIGIYPASEVVHVAGIASLGPLPEPVQLTLIYGGAIAATSKTPGPARDFIRFLAAPENRAVWRHEGFEIPH